MNGSQFDGLQRVITDSEKIFSVSAEKYPPLPEFAMPQDYFDGNRSNINANSMKYDHKEVLLKVKESIEKAISRSAIFLVAQEFSKQRKSVQNIIDILNSL